MFSSLVARSYIQRKKKMVEIDFDCYGSATDSSIWYGDTTGSSATTDVKIKWSIDHECDCADTTTLGSSYKTYDYACTSTSITTNSWFDSFYYKKKHAKIKLSTNGWSVYNTPRQSPGDKLREIIQSRQAPLILGTRKALTTVEQTTDPREFRARETLLRVLGDEKFKRFMRNGFVSVRAKSGLVYQIFPGHGITNVYQNGEQTERLCVVLKGDFPPTDSLIMRYLLILNDERDFRNHAIEHKVIKKRPQERKVIEFEPLTNVWDRLKPVKKKEKELLVA